MIERKTWSDFRETGLLFLINQLLHVFGWAICMQVDDDKITDVYPARVKFRGFDEKSQTEQHIKIAGYLAENAAILKQEAEAE